MKATRAVTPLKRVRFFDGQILSAKDFEAEQQYQLEQHRRHNRSFHGYGVVSGLDVSTKDNVVNVSSGTAIDRLGNEITVPDCARISVKQPGSVAYVILRCHERETDPVPSDSASGVEFSRVEEGFEVAITVMQGLRSLRTGKIVEPQNELGVVLARLGMARGRWQIDRKFRRPRTR